MEKKDNDAIIDRFNKFVSDHQCDSDNITHTILKSKGGKFCFEGKDYQTFMEKYIEIVKLGIDTELHFVERPNKHGVTFLFIDVDYDQHGSDRVYEDNHIKEIIAKTNEYIKEHFDVTKHQLTTFVTEKPVPTQRTGKDDIYKDGFHIYYPYLPLKEEYRYFITDYLVNLMVENMLLNGIDYQNDAENIFDTSVIKSNGILMIGSRKEGGHPYKLTQIYDSKMGDVDTKEYDIEEIVYLLSNQRYDADGSVDAFERYIGDIEEVYNKYDRGNRRKANNLKKMDNIDRAGHNEQSKKKGVVAKRDVELARALIKLLNKNRAHEYKSWTRVGFALCAIDDSLYKDFVEFSKRDMRKFNEGKVTCEYIWKAGKKLEGAYSIGSIRHWARLDNPTEYYRILRKINDDTFGRAETSKHVDIADVVYELYKDRFVCVDIVKKKWYEFQDHRWVCVQSAYTLENLISNEVRRMMAIYCSEKLSDTVHNEEGFDHDTDVKKYTRLMKMVDNLGDVRFRENVVRACSNKFYDDKFQSKLDTNSYLVGFQNGVYDLKEMGFRDGLPTDYISKSVGYNWVEYDENDTVFEKIKKFFSEVQVDDDMREYLFTFIASIFRGISDQKVHIWTGGGSNGKSATVDLIKNMLGDYFGVVPVTLLTRKRGSSSSATPELADKQGKRLLVVQEPEYNDVIFVGQMKEYSGKDTIQARPLYGDPYSYVPQFNMILTCNNLPYIPTNDEGTWRRLRVTPFESHFVDSEPSEPREFLIDEELQEEFPKWAQPLIWLVLTKYYPKFVNGINGRKYKILEPEKVKQYTKNYKMDSDVYMEFLEENIIKTGNDKDIEQIGYLFETFKTWYQSSYTEKPPAKKNFIQYLKKAGYKLDKQKLYGVKYALELS